MRNKLYYLFNTLIVVSVLLSACGPAATETAAPVETEAPVSTEAPTEAPTEVPTEAPTEAPAGPLTVLIDNDEGPITPANFNTFIGFWLVGWIY
ncbi:MAG TPA: hypothetical protein VFC02_15035, partial [Anaerolineales bacterium]|nr:hypothetical protein [Anaerolineales bacterium]